MHANTNRWSGHAKRPYHCSCGRVVFGNGAKASRRAMHGRKDETFGHMTDEKFARRFPDWTPQSNCNYRAALSEEER